MQKNFKKDRPENNPNPFPLQKSTVGPRCSLLKLHAAKERHCSKFFPKDFFAKENLDISEINDGFDKYRFN